MRLRAGGNPFHDQHELTRPEFSMRVYDFVAPPTRPHDVALIVEHIVPELCVFNRGLPPRTERVWTPAGWQDETVKSQDGDPVKQGWVNGAIWTSWRPDGPAPALYVAIGLYDTPCSDSQCRAGHMEANTQSIYRQAPSIEPWQIEAIQEEIGEHPSYRLGQGEDARVLSRLGFTPMDAPLVGEHVTKADLSLALSQLQAWDDRTFRFKLAQLGLVEVAA